MSNDWGATNEQLTLEQQAEPLLYQYRMKKLFGDKFPWSYWQECSKEVYLQYKKQPAWDYYIYESRALYSQPTSETTDQLMSIIDLYEKALLAAFPQGASGEAFEYWNEARKALNNRKHILRMKHEIKN